jgi:hypothetical protein
MKAIDREAIEQNIAWLEMRASLLVAKAIKPMHYTLYGQPTAGGVKATPAMIHRAQRMTRLAARLRKKLDELPEYPKSRPVDGVERLVAEAKRLVPAIGKSRGAGC